MEPVAEDACDDRLYRKALGIIYERRTGRWLPIIRHLALRRHVDAMREWADWLSGESDTERFGSPADGYSPSGCIGEHISVEIPWLLRMLLSVVSTETT